MVTNNVHLTKQGKIDLLNKVKLNGEATNINFVENRVAQDGLVENKAVSTDIETSVIVTNVDFMKSTQIMNALTGSRGFYFEIGSDKKIRIRYFNTSGTTSNIALLDSKGDRLEVSTNKLYNFCLHKKGDMFSAYVDGNVYTGKTQNDLIDRIGSYESLSGVISCVYTRMLSQEEINHNLLVLNNSPSISTIETTDSSSVKTNLLLSSNATHVEMPNGKTLREFAYQTLDWENKTSDGSDISVTNGKEAWVRNAKISGNTVNNIATTGEYTIQADGKTWLAKQTAVSKDFIQQGVKYYIHVFVYENTFINNFMVHNKDSGIFTPSCEVGSGKTGYFKFEVTPKETITSYTILSQVKLATETGKVRYAICVTKENVDLNSVIPKGLSSTKAIITNNGLKYSFYATDEDKASGKVIDLGGIEGARNTLEILDEGSGIYTQKTYQHTFKKEEIVANVQQGISGGSTFYYIDLKASTLGIPEVIAFTGIATCPISYNSSGSWNDNTFVGMITSDNVKGFRFYRCGTTKEEFDKYIEGVTVRYQVATPIIIYIPKEIMMVIATEQSNLISITSPVKPSGIELSIAVDKISGLESRLKLIEAVMKSKSNLSSLFNYSEDEYEQNKNLETELI